jgi:hypothetical protein
MSNAIINLRNEIRTLIKPQDVKVYTPISGSINESNLVVAIKAAEDTWIKPTMGKLYDELLSELALVNDDPDKLPDGSLLPYKNYKELYSQMYLSHVWYSYFTYVKMFSIKVEEKGVMFNSSDYAENGGLKALSTISEEIKTVAERYMTIFQCYLNDKYKEKEEDLNPMGQKTTSLGLYIPQRYFKKCKKC